MLNTRSRWYAYFCYFTLFCFAYTTVYPAARITNQGLRFSAQSLNLAHAQTAPQLTAPDTAYAQHPSHQRIISVARQQSQTLSSEVIEGKLTLTYHIHNYRPEALQSVLLKTRLDASVEILESSVSPSNGPNSGEFYWVFAELAPFEHKSVTLTLRLTDLTVTNLDAGAQVYADYKARKVSASSIPAFLLQGAVDPAYLNCTIDADCKDPLVIAKAAELGNDPQAIFQFVRDEIAYEAYEGSLRGARGTLWTHAGNALDQASLLIALLRASGIPARYAAGTLTQERAQALIAGMYNSNRPSVGSYPDDVEAYADPLNDAQVLATVSRHHWVEMSLGGGFVAADTSFANSALTESFAAKSASFAEVAQAQRHQFVVKVHAELLNTLFGGGRPARRTVLNQAFNTVEVVGKPISLSHMISTTGASGFVFFNRVHTYTPYLVINQGDDPTQDQALTGAPYQEVYSNFAGFNEVLTGTFVEMTSVTPSGVVASHERPIFDRGGYGVRKFGGNYTFPADLGERRAFEPSDVYTMLAGGSFIDPNAMIPYAETLRDMEPAVRTALQTFETSESDADLQALESLLRPASRMKTSVALLMHAAASDKFLQDLRASLGTSAYWDSSRILVAHAEANERGYSFSLDLRHNRPRVSAGPGEPERMSAVFNNLRGFLEGSLEAEVTKNLAGGTEVVNATSIFEKAYEMGVDFEALISGDDYKVGNFAISTDAKARILDALAGGKIVITPTRSVEIGGRTTVSWYEVDPISGEVIAVNENGGHAALAGYAALAGDNGMKKVAWLIIGTGHGIVEGTFTFLTSFFEKVHTKPLDEVLKDAKYAVLDKAIMKVLNYAVGKKVKDETAKQAIKLAQCFIKVKPASGSVGVEDNGLKFALCLAQLATSVSVLDPLWAEIDKVGKDWYTWGVVAGILGTAAWIDYSLGIDPEILPFRVTDFSRPEWFATGELALANSVGAGAFDVTGTGARLSGWVAGDDRTSYYTADALAYIRNGSLTAGPLSVATTDQPLVLRGDNLLFNGASIPQAMGLSGATGQLNLQRAGASYALETTGNAARVLYPNQSTYEYNLSPAEELQFRVALATSFNDTYRIDIEAPLGWGARLNGDQVSLVAKPGAAPGVYPVYVSARALADPQLRVDYRINVNLQAAEPGVAVAVVADPLFTVGVGGSQLPSAFRAQITNLGPQTDSYSLRMTSVPAGFDVNLSSAQVQVAAGRQAEAGFYLMPNGELPAAGTSASFSLEVVSTTDPNIRQTITQSFVVPEINELLILSAPARLAGTPGGSVATELTLAARGNVAESFKLSASVPQGLQLTGLPGNGNLSAGETRRFDLAISLNPDLTINQELRIDLQADLCNGAPSCSVRFPTKRDSQLVVAVRSAAVAGLTNAATAASDGGFYPLGNQLLVLADALIELETNPAASTACNTIARTAGNIRTLLNSNAALLGYADAFANLATAAQSCDASAISTQTGALVADLAASMAEYRDYRFSASLYGAKQVALPGTAVSATLAVQNLGEKAITLRIDHNASSGLSVAPAANNIPLAPRASTRVPVTLTASAEGQHQYTITLTTAEGSQTRQYGGTLTSLTEPFKVLLVDTTPRLINPGDSFQVLSNIANVANVTASVDAVTTITAAGSGTPVYQSSPAIGLALPGGNRLDPYSLDFVDTTGWDDGDYRVAVTLYDRTSGAQVGAGIANLHVGSPVRAYASVSPELVPPGSATVRTQIELQRFVSGSGTNLGFTPSPLHVDRINWAAASRGAVFTGTNWTNLYLLNDELGTEVNPYVNTTYPNATANPLRIDLGAVRLIDEVDFMLWNGDYRFYRYRLEGSVDGVNFFTIQDKSTGEARGRQRLTFPATEMRYLRLYGLFNSANNGFHLIEEFRVIGEAEGTPVPVQSLVIDAVEDAGNSYTAGQAVELNAGIYEVRYERGAISPWASDADNGGKTWSLGYQVEVPSANKFYMPHWVHEAFTRYATVEEAEADNFGASYLLYMPVHGNAYFWINDGTPVGNRGTLTLSLRQISGAASSLLPRVRDAMTRSVTWQQRELAAWDNWAHNGAGACYGCHIQSQGMAGLSESIEKLPDLPINRKIFDLAESSFRGWQDQAGWISPRHGGSHRVTQTSLWAWSASYFDEPTYLNLAGPVVNSLDYLFSRQGATGWDSDHSAPPIYTDGAPSATHTAGNIQAMARYLTSSAGEQRLDSPDPATPAEIYFAQSEPNVTDIRLGQLSGITGIQLTITDTFASNKNFVINEVEFFNGAEKVPVAAAEASFSQSGYPIAATFNGIVTGNSDGWAHWPRNVTTQPAIGLWKFNGPVNIDRMRLHQRYDASNHKIRRFTVRQTSAAAPTLASSFSVITPDKAVSGLDKTLVLERLQRAADTFLSDTWPYARNLRTAAQTLIGLDAAAPFLTPENQQRAVAKIGAIEQWLREQQFEGGWKKHDRATYGPQTYQSAQALEALLVSTNSSVDPAILAATNYLLDTQQRSGAWTSVDLDKELAATTWVEIALPTLFERLSSLTFRVEHDLPSQNLALVPNSEWPQTSYASTASTRVWELLLEDSSQTLRLDVNLSNLQAGQVVPVSEGTRVQYASVEGEGSFELPPLQVAVKHILAVDPSTRTLPPGSSATYQVTVENLLQQSDTFQFEITGLPAGWASTPAPVTAAPGARITFPAVVQVPVAADLGEYNFSINTLSSLGVKDSAGAQLIVDGTALPLALDSRGVIVDVIPGVAIAGQGTQAQYVARVFNLGDGSDSFTLSAQLPAGLSAEFERSELVVNPGYQEYVDVRFTIKAAPGTAAGDIPFTVNATYANATLGGASDTAVLRVLPLGVDVALTPGTGSPEDVFTVTVTNLGDQPDTFDLALGGIVALGASPLPASVSLAAGQSRSWTVNLANLGVFSAGDAALKASAVSQANNSVRDEDSARVVIGPHFAYTAALDPAAVEFVGLDTAQFTLRLANVGNQEDGLSIRITGITGPALATLAGPLAGREGNRVIREARFPALSEGSVPLLVEMTGYGTAQVHLEVRSLSTDQVTRLVATVNTVDPNQAPVANAGGTYTVLFGDTAVLSGAASADDGNYQPLTYSWTLDGKPAGSTLSSADLVDAEQVSASFVADVRGQYRVLLTVFDGEKSASDIALVNVVNNPPVANAGSDINAGVGYNTVLDGSASSDRDGDLLTYSWAFITLPTDSLLDNDDLGGATTAKPNFTADVAGTYVLRLTVADNFGGSAQDEVTVTAAVLNVAPNAVVTREISVPFGSVVTLDGSASYDPDGPAALTYLWELIAVPSGSALTSANLVDADNVRASFTPDKEGDFRVRLTVFDGLDRDRAEAVVHVLHVNVAPRANAGPDSAVRLGEMAWLDGSLSRDPDNGPAPLSFRWQFVSVPEFSALTDADLVGADSDSALFTPDKVGIYQLQLSVSDGELSDTDRTLVDVLPPPRCNHEGKIAISERVIVANKPESNKGTAAFTQVEFTFENTADFALVGPWSVIFDITPSSVMPSKVDGLDDMGRPYLVLRPGNNNKPLAAGKSVKEHVKFLHKKDQAFSYNIILQNVCTPEESYDHNRSGHGDGTNPGQGDGRENTPNTGTNNPNNAGR